MSNLKYQSLDELQESERDCMRYIGALEKKIIPFSQKLSGQRERLKWIRKHIERKKQEQQPEIIELRLTSEELRALWKPPVPFQVSLRSRLNEAGFMFEDDGKFSVVHNTNPIPVGEFYLEKDNLGNVYYKQVIHRKVTC